MRSGLAMDGAYSNISHKTRPVPIAPIALPSLACENLDAMLQIIQGLGDADELRNLPTGLK